MSQNLTLQTTQDAWLPEIEMHPRAALSKYNEIVR